MATQQEVIAKAQLDANTINDNFAYLDTEVKKKADSSSIGNAALTIKKNNTAIGTFTANATSPVAVNISVPTKVSDLSDAGDYAKKTDIVSAITPKGSVAFANLPTPAAANLGWLYNVTDSFTTTAAFVEGAGKKYPAGTNIYVVDTGSSTYKWDVMAGFINTDAYDSHIANTTIHVTSTEKGNWNDAVSGLATHTANTTIHVTSTEKSTWNNKADKSTTLSGYGITNAYTKTETDAYLTSCFNVTITPLGTNA